jgi:hypothetical protein
MTMSFESSVLVLAHLDPLCKVTRKEERDGCGSCLDHYSYEHQRTRGSVIL